ncbi:MAG: FAD-dependent oxidoreductase [Lachnospiraceae bacterium]|nr:FAD-dependent oxidoreductase [Lachnospiraceae bacterium]
MIRVNQIKVFYTCELNMVYEKTAKALKIQVKDILDLHIVKKSIDARKKPDIWYVYVVDVSVRNEKEVLKRAKNPNASLVEYKEYTFPNSGEAPLKERPIIVGSGPAGLFCGYFLAKAGYRPIILEQGKCVQERLSDVEVFWNTGKLSPFSNVQFGEGGAGTFSDGKLNTLIKDKDGKGKKVLEVFVECGAPKEILYDSKPHIGTDILMDVVTNLRNKIIQMGGEVRFENKLTNVCLNQHGELSAIEINHAETIPCSVLVLAIGHSARDTFSMLYEHNISMEAKAFAVGMRVQHLQSMINQSQYGDADMEFLPTASYKVTAQTSYGRGVYSFCMCPGGYVVNASSEEGRLTVNGMSYSKRDGANANSAIIVSVTPEDYDSDHPLAGVEFQRRLEQRAFEAGKGMVPIQTFGAFCSKVLGDSLPSEFTFEPAIKGKYAEADLTDILPTECNKALIEGMHHFGKNIDGFDRTDAILAGIESRTSSPVRIPRDQFGEANISGIYPCGEGAGYAGGITSAAMDGILIAEKIALKYAKW